MTVSSTKIADICLTAGKIMLINGGETYRVEDTMSRIAAAFGYGSAHSFVTPTGIIFSLEDSEATKFVRISERTVNLEKVTLVNSISRQIAEGMISAEEAILHLDEIENNPHSYSIPLRILASGLVSACFLIMFLGQWEDFIPAFLAGSIGFTCFFYFHKVIKIQFFAEFLASFVIGTLAYWMVHLGVGVQMDKIIIGSVMPLVPGLLITNAVRDLMAGHLVSGLSKGAEAFLTAFAIGSGVAVVFTIY